MSTYSILVTNNASGCNTEIEQQLSVTGCTSYIVRLASNSNALGPFDIYVDDVIYYSGASRNDMFNGIVVTLECATPTPTPTLSLTPSTTSTPTPTQTSSPTVTPTVTNTPTSTLIPVDICPILGSAGNFAILGSSTVTNTGGTVITGDLGLYPGTSVTGFPPGVVSGTTHITDAFALNAKADANNAFVGLNALTPTGSVAADIGGTTITPGVYSVSSSLAITGTVILNGNGDSNSLFVFQIPSTFIPATNAIVSLINGASAGNVYWVVGSSATLSVSSTTLGNIIAQVSVTLNTDATLTGRAIALTGAVTLDTNIVTYVQCGGNPLVTPTPTQSQTPTNSQTPTQTPTNTETPTQTPTNTETPTQTPTNTETPTETPTQTPTPTNQPLFAYGFIDQAAVAPKNNLRDWMIAQGSTFRGFNEIAYNNPSTNQAIFSSQMNSYISYSGWGIYNPAIIVTGVTTTSVGTDLQGQPIQAYKFQTAVVPSGAFSGTSAWVTWFVSTGATNGQTYSTISYGPTAAASTTATLPLAYLGLVINYSGNTIPPGTYKMYTTYSGSAFRPLVGNLPQFYRGGTLT